MKKRGVKRKKKNEEKKLKRWKTNLGAKFSSRPNPPNQEGKNFRIKLVLKYKILNYFVVCWNPIWTKPSSFTANFADIKNTRKIMSNKLNP